MDLTETKKQLKLTQWAAIINEYRSSGLRLKDWLSENGYTKDQFYYWKRKVEAECLDSLQTSFVEISVPAINRKQAKQLPAVPGSTSISTESQAVSAAIHCGSLSIDIYDSAPTELICRLLEAAAYVK